MSISAVLHSRPPLRRLPETMEDAKADFRTFFENDLRERLSKHGKSGARVFGVALISALLTAYAPDTFAAQQHMPVSTATIFVQVMETTQVGLVNGVEFASNAAAGAVEFAGALAVKIQDDIVAPSMGVVRASGNGVADWLSSQRETVNQMGVGMLETVKEITDYLVPKTKGEMVERGVIIIAALKSFAEGVSFAMRGLKKIGQKVTGREDEPVTVTPPPVQVHHHHYYADGTKHPDAVQTPVSETPARTVREDAANDNDYDSPHG